MAGRERRVLVPAVYRAAEILDLLARQPDLTMGAIREHLGLPRSSLFNLLSALEDTGLVQRDSDSGRYRLGLRILSLAGALQSRLDVRQAAAPELRRLTEETQETTHLGVLETRDLEVIYIEKIDSPQAVKLASYVGRKVPSHCTAMGKVLLAALPDSYLLERMARRPLEPKTANTVTAVDRLMAMLALVREQGYAIDDEEHEPGVRCVAAPVRGPGGEVVAAVSVSGPAARLTHARLAELVPRVQSVAATISSKLGYQPLTSTK